jgi:hypothetical protein
MACRILGGTFIHILYPRMDSSCLANKTQNKAAHGSPAMWCDPTPLKPPIDANEKKGNENYAEISLTKRPPSLLASSSIPIRSAPALSPPSLLPIAGGAPQPPQTSGSSSLSGAATTRAPSSSNAGFRMRPCAWWPRETTRTPRPWRPPPVAFSSEQGSIQGRLFRPETAAGLLAGARVRRSVELACRRPSASVRVVAEGDQHEAKSLAPSSRRVRLRPMDQSRIVSAGVLSRRQKGPHLCTRWAISNPSCRMLPPRCTKYQSCAVYSWYTWCPRFAFFSIRLPPKCLDLIMLHINLWTYRLCDKRLIMIEKLSSKDFFCNLILITYILYLWDIIISYSQYLIRSDNHMMNRIITLNVHWCF